MTKFLPYSTIGKGGQEEGGFIPGCMALEEPPPVHSRPYACSKKAHIFWVDAGLYQNTQLRKWSAGCILLLRPTAFVQ